jgi:hypothetical protein
VSEDLISYNKSVYLQYQRWYILVIKALCSSVRPHLLILRPGEPQLLEGAADAQDAASNPGGVVALDRQ